MTDFISRVGSRAAEEKAAGRTDVWIDLKLFEDLATTMLTSAAAAPASSSNSRTATSQSMPVDQAAPWPPVADAAGMSNRIDTPSFDASARPSPNLSDLTTGSGGPAPMPLGNPTGFPASPATGAADMNAGQPAPTAGKTAVAIVIPPTRTATEEQRPMAAIYARRGDEKLAVKDISAARKFYEYAANAGSARAAMALARTYDPAFLTQLGAVGVRPDPMLAANWYRTAAALGAPDAEARLHTLSTQAAN